MFLKKNFHYLKIISIIFSLSMLVTCVHEKKAKTGTNIDVATTNVANEENTNKKEDINKEEEEKKQHDAHMQHLFDIHDDIVCDIARIDINDEDVFVRYETITTNDFAKRWQCCQEIRTKIANCCQEEKDLDVILKLCLNLLDEKQNWMIENHHHPLIILCSGIFHLISCLPAVIIILCVTFYFCKWCRKLEKLKNEYFAYWFGLILCFAYVIRNLFNINFVNFNQSLYNTFMADCYMELTEGDYGRGVGFGQDKIDLFFADRSRFFFNEKSNAFYYHVPLMFSSNVFAFFDFCYLSLYFVGLLGLFPYQKYKYMTDKDIEIDQELDLKLKKYSDVILFFLYYAFTTSLFDYIHHYLQFYYPGQINWLTAPFNWQHESNQAIKN